MFLQSNFVSVMMRRVRVGKRRKKWTMIMLLEVAHLAEDELPTF